MTVIVHRNVDTWIESRRVPALLVSIVVAVLATGCPRSDRPLPPPPPGMPSADGGVEESPAESCLERLCSAELAACGAGCRTLLDCATSCDTDACVDGCTSRASEADLEQASNLLSCYDANCSSDGGTGDTGDTGTSGGGASTAEINQCIDGIAVFCGCASAADSPCSDSEVERLYESCLAGHAWEGFGPYVCLGGYSPSSLEGCLAAYETCLP